MFFCEYKEKMLPFVCDINPEDLYAGILSIEARGSILSENKYFYASYEVDVKYIDELANLLKDSYGKEIKIICKIKKEKIKSFKIDLDSLVQAYNDDRFGNLELVGWAVNDRSFKDINLCCI